eukprot:6672717-Prymnesium_polylepis.1
MLLGAVMLLLPIFMGWPTVRGAAAATTQPVRLSASTSGIILKVPACALTYLVMVSCLLWMISTNAYLVPYLKAQHGIEEWLYGVLMTTAVVGYGTGAGLAPICEKAVGSVQATVLGSVFFALGILLIAPTPLLGGAIPNDNFWVPAGAYQVMTLGAGLLSTIVTPLLIAYATRSGFSEEDAIVQAAALQVFVMGITLLVGPPLGGFLADAFGPEWALTYSALSAHGSPHGVSTAVTAGTGHGGVEGSGSARGGAGASECPSSSAPQPAKIQKCQTLKTLQRVSPCASCEYVPAARRGRGAALAIFE